MSPPMTTNPYLADTVLTASPGRLLVMLYDRLALDLVQAEHCVERADVGGAHDRLVHAQDIITELRSTLNLEVWPEGQKLKLVYDYLLEQLVVANMRKDADVVRTVRQLVAPIHDAWRHVEFDAARAPSVAPSHQSDGA